MRRTTSCFQMCGVTLSIFLCACGGAPETNGASPTMGEAERAAVSSSMTLLEDSSFAQIAAYPPPSDPRSRSSAGAATRACAEPERSGYTVPSDFAISYVIGPANGEWEQLRRLRLLADGWYSVALLDPPTSGSLASSSERVIREGRLGDDGVRNVYAAVRVCDLFSLDGYFFDPSRLEGSTATLRSESVQVLAVMADGRSHAVAARNVYVPRFLDIRTTLFTETGGVF